MFNTQKQVLFAFSKHFILIRVSYEKKKTLLNVQATFDKNAI